MSRLVLAALALMLMVSSACKKQDPPVSTTPADTAPPAVTPAAAAEPIQSAAPAATLAPQAVIASTEYQLDSNIRADLLEVRRISGGALFVKWRTTNVTPRQSPAGTVAVAEPKAIRYDFSWDDLYYVDPAENKKYQYLKDSEGNRIIDIFYGDLKPGESKTNWAKFPAPPPASTKISITLPKFSPLEDVPIAQ